MSLTLELEADGVRLVDLPDVLTPRQVAAVLQCSVGTVLAKCRTGEIPSLRVGRLVRIPKSQFEIWLKEG